MKAIDFNICKFNLALFLRSVLLLSPIMLLFYQENGLTAQELFFFQGIFYLVSILSELPVGYLSDTIFRKNVLIVSFFIFLAITLLWFFMHGYYVIMTCEILFAISKVMMDNSMSGYLSDYLNNKGDGKSMVKYYGYLNFYLSLGTAVAAILGTYLYKQYGSKLLIVLEFLIILTAIILVSTLPNFVSKKEHRLSIQERVSSYMDTAKAICGNGSIKYHILYSGTLTSLSILFAISFQPVMQNALFPIMMFGVIAFMNHGMRALSSFVAGHWLRNFNIRKLIIPLFCLYAVAFGCVFLTIYLKSVVVITGLIFIICAIIGVQLIFSILHVSRLHKFVEIDNRGNLMSINNFVSRSAAAVILLSSKFLFGKIGLLNYYGIIFMIFLIICAYLAYKTYQVKE